MGGGGTVVGYGVLGVNLVLVCTSQKTGAAAQTRVVQSGG